MRPWSYAIILTAAIFIMAYIPSCNDKAEKKERLSKINQELVEMYSKDKDQFYKENLQKLLQEKEKCEQTLR